MKKEDKKEKVLHTYEGEIIGSEYKEMLKYVPFYRTSFILKTLIGVFIISIISLIKRNPTTEFAYFVMALFIIYEIYNLTIGKIRYYNRTKKVIDERIDKGLYDKEYKIDFYDDCFIRDGKIDLYKVFYADIETAIETDTHFYLCSKKRRRNIILNKEECSKELIEFLREKLPNLEKKELKK